MLTFEEFNDYIKKIREQLEYSDNLDDALRKMSPDFGGFFNTAIDIAIDLLKRVMNDKDEYVELIVDKELLEDEYIGCHPCINTSTLKIRTSDIQKFAKKVGHRMTTVKL